MKTMKKLTALVVALVMALAMTVTAFADDTAEPIVHTYAAYQIFAGTQAADDSKLAGVTWGTGVNADNMLSDLRQDTTLGTVMNNCTTAAEVAEKMSSYSDDSNEAKAFARIAYANKAGDGTACEAGTTSLDAGYYLVVDTTNVSTVDDVKNLALLQLTNKGTFDIRTKVDKPTVEKKVDDKNDSNTDQDAEEWEDSADYDIGDDVPFKITATLPTQLAEYKTYKLVFHDEGCEGLSVIADSFVVKVGNTTLNADQYTKEISGNNFTVTINDVKALGATAGGTVTVEYKAKLNESAKIGSEGNPNTVSLEYSNDANYTGDGEKSPTGETPKDKVIVFTYKVVADKVDEKGNPLKGAGFTLYKYDVATQKYVAVGGEQTGADMTQFAWNGLDDGQYKIVETTVPDGYNKIADQEFTVRATHDDESDDPKLTDLTGNALTGSVIAFEKNVSAGSLSTKIENKSGSTLPETGGMGTTVIYIVGAILVLGAGVLLITRRRLAK